MVARDSEGGMTLTEFHARAGDAFGRMRAEYLVRSLHLAACGGRTAAEALEVGEDVKSVWLALCEEMDVPELLR